MQQTSIIIIILILYVSLVDERGNLEIETDEKRIDETGIDETVLTHTFTACVQCHDPV